MKTAKILWLIPICGVVLTISLIGLLILSGGKWKKEKPVTREIVQVTPSSTEPEGMPKLPPAGTGAAMGAMADKENDDDTEPDTPDEPEQPVVIGKPDPELDKFVEKEAKNYEPAKKPASKLLAPVSVPAARQTPATVAGRIDQILDQKRSEAKIPASPQADDAEFLRRVYLDLLGTIPPATRVRSFLADKSAEKRQKLVEELLADSRFGQNFAHYWHDLLVKRDPDNNRLIKTHDVFLKWLSSEFNHNKPWDQIVRSMLTASGDQALVGETFFVMANVENGQPQANKIVGTAAALFLGNQLMCAECHVHPMTPEWKQDDFWGLAAFFGKTRAERQIGGKKNLTALAKITDDAVAAKGKVAMTGKASTLADGSIPIPDPRNDGKYIGSAKARLLGEASVEKTQVSRTYAADWFTSPKNPFFARAAVNRLWAQFFARGFINPLDDIRPDSVATHPEALELLAGEFIASKFDIKHMIRIITQTQAYQRSSRTLTGNEEDEEHYSHMALKVLTPRMLFASLAVATNNTVDAPMDEVTNSKPVKVDTAGKGLAFFDTREYDENPAEYTYGVPQLLKLMNSLLPPACDKAGAAAAKLGGRDKAIEHLYLSALGRLPTSAEQTKMVTFAAKQADAAKAYSSILWVLLNSAEFMNNH